MTHKHIFTNIFPNHFPYLLEKEKKNNLWIGHRLCEIHRVLKKKKFRIGLLRPKKGLHDSRTLEVAQADKDSLILSFYGFSFIILMCLSKNPVTNLNE